MGCFKCLSANSCSHAQLLSMFCNQRAMLTPISVFGSCTKRVSNERKKTDSFELFVLKRPTISSGKGAVFQHACYRCQQWPNMHVPAPNMRFCKNPMSTSWQSLAWHLKTPTWHFKTSTWHFKTQNMVFQNSEHGVSLGAGHAQATTLWRARALFFLTQKKSPHGLHHLLAYDRFPSPQTSWANPAWPRTPDSDKQ